MVSQNSLADLRSHVADLERRAGRKISRIKRQAGAVVAGSKFDPRKEKGRAAKMRRRDLETYARRLSGFVSRGTQFEAGVRGAPLPRQKLRVLDAVTDQARSVAQARIDPFRNERLPMGRDAKGKLRLADETIGQRQDKIRTGHPTAMNMGYIPPKLKAFNIKDVDSLDKLIKANRKRSTKKWEREEHKRAQVELGKMVEVFNDPGLVKDAMSLTYGQFDMMWNLTPFADKMSLSYHSIQAKFTAKQQVPESVIQDQINEAKAIIEWVKKFKI